MHGWKYHLFTLLKISIFHIDEIKANDFGWKFKEDSAHVDWWWQQKIQWSQSL